MEGRVFRSARSVRSDRRNQKQVTVQKFRKGKK